MSHANARLTHHGRCLLVRRVVFDGRPVAHVAAELGVSRQCAHRWVGRFRDQGWDGPADRRRVHRDAISSRWNGGWPRCPSPLGSGDVPVSRQGGCGVHPDQPWHDLTGGGPIGRLLDVLSAAPGQRSADQTTRTCSEPQFPARCAEPAAGRSAARHGVGPPGDLEHLVRRDLAGTVEPVGHVRRPQPARLTRVPRWERQAAARRLHHQVPDGQQRPGRRVDDQLAPVGGEPLGSGVEPKGRGGLQR
ncbi:leucine zipper domain-containing protein [Actinomadura sp. 3N407]|uniref:leucine zipper domain-containing protein n=1 Tax=Actinomadura sp. 3N407 TaxID=3457423 RepID=UPI003FCCED7E